MIADASPARSPSGAPSTGLPPAPVVAREVFADRERLAVRYAGMLAGRGVAHGLIGPRELDRLWQRHLLNGALLGSLIGAGLRVVDVGSGAGLPGLPLAIARPDLSVDLLEPTLRRVEFLTDAVEVLGLGDQVRVVRGRAEDRAVISRLGGADTVAARAVAPLGRLVGWCLPLLGERGELLALKGESVASEVERDGAEIAAAGARVCEVRLLGREGVDATHVVRVKRRAARRGRQR